MELTQKYQDLAIILAWPDSTIRGDEKWMMFFKKIGLVKNLNFKVGHTGVILVDRINDALLYYDFGRYIAPRGYGRARSMLSDPRLAMETRPQIVNNHIQNLDEIAEELGRMQDITQGYGRLYCSIAEGLSFEKAKQYADNLVREGAMRYGAVAKGNNNCSRFITRLLVHSSKKYHLLHSIHYPETIKSSPMSNVVNIRPDRQIYRYDESSGLQSLRMSRTQSLLFLLKQLGDNISSEKASALPDDTVIGSMEPKVHPPALPEDAQWLGGVGEGAWYTVQSNGRPGHFIVSRFTEKGEREYKMCFTTEQQLEMDKPFAVTYDSHLLFTNIIQKGNKVVLYPNREDVSLDGRQSTTEWNVG